VLRKELKITEVQNARAARGPAFQDLPRALKDFSAKTSTIPSLADKSSEN